jgi:hypothetical protein
LDRQRPQEKRIDEAEYGSIGADSERQRNNGHHGKSWTPPHHAKSVSKVLPNNHESALAKLTANASDSWRRKLTDPLRSQAILNSWVLQFD